MVPGAGAVTEPAAAVVFAAGLPVAVRLAGNAGPRAALLTARAAGVAAGDVLALALPVQTDREGAGAGAIAQAAAAIVVAAGGPGAVRDAELTLAGLTDLPRRTGAAREGAAAVVGRRAALHAQGVTGHGGTTAPVETDGSLGAAGVSAGSEGARAGEVLAAELVIGTIPAGQDAAAAVAGAPAGRAQPGAIRRRTALPRMAHVVHRTADVSTGSGLAYALSRIADLVISGTRPVADPLAAIVRAAGLSRAVRLAGDAHPGLAGLPGAAAVVATADVLADTDAGLAGRPQVVTGPRAQATAAVCVAAGRTVAGQRAAGPRGADLAGVTACASAFQVGTAALPGVVALAQGTAGAAVQHPATAVRRRAALCAHISAGHRLAAPPRGADRVRGAAGPVTGQMLALADTGLADLVIPGAGAVAQAAAAVRVAAGRTATVRNAWDADPTRADLVGGAAGASAVVEGADASARLADLVVAGAAPVADITTAVVRTASLPRAGGDAVAGADAGLADLARRAANVAAGDIVADADLKNRAGRVQTAGPAVQDLAAAVQERAAIDPLALTGDGSAAGALVADLIGSAAGVPAGEALALALEVHAAGRTAVTEAAVQRTPAAIGGRPTLGADVDAGHGRAARAPRADLVNAAALTLAGNEGTATDAVEAALVRARTAPVAEAPAAVVVAASGAVAVRITGGADPSLAAFSRWTAY